MAELILNLVVDVVIDIWTLQRLARRRWKK
jgi:hypothetical protein